MNAIVISIALILASNASEKTLVRQQPGTIVTSPVYQGPLVADDVNTVAHLTWNGTALVDSKGNTWGMQGVVPQITKNGKTPAGSGPYSDTAYYLSGAANDVLDFAGDFTGVIVWVPKTSNTTRALAADGTYNVSGWVLSDRQTLYISQSGGVSSVAMGDPALDTLSVTCFGRASGKAVGKQNLGTFLTAAGAVTPTPATSTYAGIGRYESGGVGRNASGIIYEAWFSSSTPTDALCTSIMQRVKLRVGLTAW